MPTSVVDRNMKVGIWRYCFGMYWQLTVWFLLFSVWPYHILVVVISDQVVDFVFKINNDTEVYGSCSATLNGEVFVFGGENTSYNRRKQVSMNQQKVQNNKPFRSQKMAAVN